jgi:hypothetical protein
LEGEAVVSATRIIFAVGYECGHAALYVDGNLVTDRIDNMNPEEIVTAATEDLGLDLEIRTIAVESPTKNWPKSESKLKEKQ